MTNRDILERLKNLSISELKITNYRPCIEQHFKDKAGITFWIKNGDRFAYFPHQMEPMEVREGILTPCDVCKFNPPSSGDGKPCTMCPAVGRGDRQ